jgi:hypothetical protein
MVAILHLTDLTIFKHRVQNTMLPILAKRFLSQPMLQAVGLVRTVVCLAQAEQAAALLTLTYIIPDLLTKYILVQADQAD